MGEGRGARGERGEMVTNKLMVKKVRKGLATKSSKIFIHL